MKREIERKFLVDTNRLPKLKKRLQITQVYYSRDPEIRIRIQDRDSFLTIKTVGLVARNEYEYKIPLTEAKKLINLTNLKVEKTRFNILLNKLRWEIDFYRGKNKGLVVAEVELPAESYKFNRPLWVREEVTEDLRYRNQSLAIKPFTTWSK